MHFYGGKKHYGGPCAAFASNEKKKIRRTSMIIPNVGQQKLRATFFFREINAYDSVEKGYLVVQKPSEASRKAAQFHLYVLSRKLPRFFSWQFPPAPILKTNVLRVCTKPLIRYYCLALEDLRAEVREYRKTGITADYSTQICQETALAPLDRHSNFALTCLDWD